MDRLLAWWDDLPDTDRPQVTAVSWLVALHLLGLVILSPWLIEDAAITFTYALHAALGEGLVAWPGGERVEGFSNPSWLILLAALRVIGVSPFLGAKLLGGLFGAITLVCVWRIGRLWFGPRRLWAVLPVAVLAVDPQHLIWNASGLENSLVVAMIAVGTWVALDDDRPAWWAASLGVLAMSRPEAPLYAAVLGGVGVLRQAQLSGAGAGVRWAVSRGAIALAPWLAWEAFSYAYFAWPFPNTYYAKIEDGQEVHPWGWSSRGWNYVRAWSVERGAVALIPLLAVGQTGLRGVRRWVGPIVGGVTLVMLIPGLAILDSLWTEPSLLGRIRVGWILALLGFLPFVGSDRPNAFGRALCWWMLGVVVVFALVTNGDWMSGHRWMSIAALPLAVLVADAAHEVWTVLPHAWRSRAVAGIVAVPIVWGIVDYSLFLGRAETTPWDISRRVAYMHGVQERLGLDHVVSLEVDFGGTMWWSGHELVDLAGLNDVAIAHHSWEPAFFGEYLYDEKRPHFMHAHASWATRTRIRDNAGWRSYVEIPGYPSSRYRFHVGNLVRRDLFEQPAFDAPNRARFQGALDVAWRLGAPVSAPGEVLHIELAWHTTRRLQRDFRAVLVLQDAARTLSWELPPAYDWVAPPGWKTSHRMVSRHTLDLPADLAIGEYDLAIVVLDVDDGAVRPVLPGRQRPLTAGYAEGEARWRRAVELVDAPTIRKRAEAGSRDARALAESGTCAEAEAMLQTARHFRSDVKWRPHERPVVRTALARCWAWQAEAAEGDEAVEAIVAARRWDHHDAEVQRVGDVLADGWTEEGDVALSRDDLERAHVAWTRAITADPTRAWLRRTIETWRDVRLGLADPPDTVDGG